MTYTCIADLGPGCFPLQNIGGPIKAVERVGGEETENNPGSDGQVYNVEVSIEASCNQRLETHNEQQQPGGVGALSNSEQLARKVSRTLNVQFRNPFRSCFSG